MKSEDVREVLRRELSGSVYAWAKAHQISISYVHDFLRGRKKTPGSRILDALNMHKRVEYEYKEPIGEKRQ
jgi:hypothetical protein